MDLKTIAGNILLTGISQTTILEHWEYRKGKSTSDIRNAVRKALKNGHHKIEFEIDWLALYLKDVLKARKKPLKQVVGAVIHDESRNLFLCGLRADKHQGWEFIGGKVEPGETHKQALQREVLEEIGCEAEVNDLIETTIYDDFLILRTFYTRIKGVPQVTVHKELRWFKPEELKDQRWLEADEPTVKWILKRGGELRG